MNSLSFDAKDAASLGCVEAIDSPKDGFVTMRGLSRVSGQHTLKLRTTLKEYMMKQIPSSVHFPSITEKLDALREIWNALPNLPRRGDLATQSGQANVQGR